MILIHTIIVNKLNYNLNLNQFKFIRLDAAKPSFEWISNGDFDNSIQIGFPDGGPNDVALLTPSIPILSSDIMDKNDPGCIFHGHLQNDTDVEVFVSGCPEKNSFQVVFSDILG